MYVVLRVLYENHLLRGIDQLLERTNIYNHAVDGFYNYNDATLARPD